MLIKRKKIRTIKNSFTPQKQTISQADIALQKAKQEAKLIIDDAQKKLQESTEKLKAAEEEAKTIIEKAKIDGEAIKEKVYNEAENILSEERIKIQEEVKELFQELFNAKRHTLLMAHNEILKIALELAEKIIRVQTSIDPNVLKTQVVESIKKATSEAERVQVYVNPEDLKSLEQSIPEIQRLFPAGVDIVALSNESVDIGSCIIESKSGQLDARFSTQLTTLQKLCEHIEVPEPNITVNENISVSEDANKKSLTPFEEIIKEQEHIPEIKDLKKSIEEHEKELIAEGLIDNNELNEEELKSELLDENFKIDIPEDEEEEANEDLEENDYIDDENNEEDIDFSSILKPKKKEKSEIQDIANEIEKNPEWSEIMEEE